MKRFIGFIIILLVISLSILPIVKAEGGVVRYTVLVLDVSGTETFEEPPSWRNVLGSKYTSSSSYGAVKDAAERFIAGAENSRDKNYIAIVAYREDAILVSDFTDDLQLLAESLSTIEEKESDRSIASGLEKAYQLLTSIQDADAVKNLVLCTTGLTDDGEYQYDGLYNQNTVASSWQNMGTEVKLYAYANAAIEVAQKIKSIPVNLYVIGLFSPIEGKIPPMSGVWDVAKFLRMTAYDLASGEDMFYEVEDIDELNFVFGELEEVIVGEAKHKIYNRADHYIDETQSDEHGHFEWINWDSSIFEQPSTSIKEMDFSKNDSLGRNLALLAGSLSAEAYHPDLLVEELKKLGFSEDNIYLYSYPGHRLNRSDARRNGKKFANDGDLAFSIASQTMNISGQEADVLFITARGTMNWAEAINDGMTDASKKFFDYIAWDWVYEFEEHIMAGLEDYLSEKPHSSLGSRPMKVFVSGHSLGGAAANLVAARLNYQCAGREEKVFESLKIEDVFAFTFGAIDSIYDRGFNDQQGEFTLEASDLEKYNDRLKNIARLYNDKERKMPVRLGFENIINIYNVLDNYGPYGSGTAGFTASGNTMYSKFGYLFLFCNKMDKYVPAKSGLFGSGSMYNRHEISGYLQAVRYGFPRSFETIQLKRIMIHCPVDVKVYSGKQLLCCIEDQRITVSSETVTAVIDEDRKTLVVPSEMEFTIQLKATDEGYMDYIVQTVEEDIITVSYRNISLEKGQRMTSSIGENFNQLVPDLKVVDIEGKALSLLLPDVENKPGSVKAENRGSEAEKETSAASTQSQVATKGTEVANKSGADRNSPDASGNTKWFWGICLVLGIMVIVYVVIQNIASSKEK